MAKKPWHQKRISHKISFSILVLAIILAAIPLTVVMSGRQQNSQQDASTMYPCGRCSTSAGYIGCWASWTESSPTCGRTPGDIFTSPVYSCNDSRCVAKATPVPTKTTVPCPDRYGNAYGGCYDKTMYSCSTGFISGRCLGSASIQCCQGTITKLTGSSSCANAGGSCMDLTKCSGAYYSGLCPGGSTTVCCTYSGVDQCGAAPYYGTCQYNTPATPCVGGRYISGKCPGPSNYMCCTSH